MNAVPKPVVSRGAPDVSRWAGSRLLEGDLPAAVRAERRDAVVTGSLAVVHELMAGDLVDEYRLLTFPVVLGQGRPLFPAGSPPAGLECLSAERVGAAVLTRYGRAAG
ncbi:dihydrofolate reductase family protein [Streptomyces sp. 5112.2]|uniref:dihydrofolate reductase family protein n=1 Tax=Streptomyces sp. 5112.2 TaxID=1938848 RepID=UPI000B19A987|nr:dihydrofolate reductase family protein [Streptomyces sp. 5112.2]